ncbi:MAG TPA: hypothetical protein VLD19_09900 [Chitinophagaceae bacterium]|nr:hypothetical protein [Chitinophagaceae bacterium]
MACSPARTVQTPAIQQGISGFVYQESGNRMPLKSVEPGGKSAEPDLPKGLSATVYIYEATSLSQVSRVDVSPFYTAIRTKQVATAHSDSTGAFTVGLAPGTYSLFVKQGDRFYANSFDSNNLINPVTVEKDRLTRTKIIVNSSATY